MNNISRVLAGSLLIILAQNSMAGVIGPDNRREPDPKAPHDHLSQSVAAMIPKDRLVQENQILKIIGPTLKSKLNLCEDERFGREKTTAECTGFLIGDDLLLTAGHCITNKADCDKYAWVFGFDAQDENAPETSDLFSCQEIVSRALYADGTDFSLIKLDRKTDRPALKYSTNDSLPSGLEVFAMGHPTGLPVKIADEATIIDNTNPILFTTDLDLFGGNSGSPVFDKISGEVIGIAVQASQNEYYKDENSNCTRVIPNLREKANFSKILRLSSVRTLPGVQISPAFILPLNIKAKNLKGIWTTKDKTKTISIDFLNGEYVARAENFGFVKKDQSTSRIRFLENGVMEISVYRLHQTLPYKLYLKMKGSIIEFSYSSELSSFDENKDRKLVRQ